MKHPTLSENGQVVWMLCAVPSGRSTSVEVSKPLTNTELFKLQSALLDSPWQELSDLCGRSAEEVSETLEQPLNQAERIARLLERHVSLALEFERLAELGIWVVTRMDKEYPALLNDRLGRAAPSIFYGAGDAGLINQPGIAVVGSRDVDPAGAEFATTVGEKIAEEGYCVVSGAARGVDRMAMNGALEYGGCTVGILAGDLGRTLRDPSLMQSIQGTQLALLCPYHPDAPFTVGAAMGRNTYIYALAERAIVVSSAEGSGGTWAGAIRYRKSAWARLYVRKGPEVPPGNERLIREGGIGLDLDEIPDGTSFLEWLEQIAPEIEECEPTAPIDPYADFLERLPGILPALRKAIIEAYDLPKSKCEKFLIEAIKDGRVQKFKKGREVIYKISEDPEQPSLFEP